MLEVGPDAFKRGLFDKLARVRKLAKDLRAENELYIEAMPMEVRAVMANKHIKLFENMAVQSGVQDYELIDGLRKASR
eukprot:3946225-Amphidinium_carterae.1